MTEEILSRFDDSCAREKYQVFVGQGVDDYTNEFYDSSRRTPIFGSELIMQNIRHVHLFRSGRNQAVRIPREFELSGNEVLIHKEGSRLIIEPEIKIAKNLRANPSIIR